MDNLEKYLKYCIIFLFFVCVYTCTFLFKTWIFPYITSKTIPFRICVEIMFLLYIILALYYPKYRPKKSIILYSLLIFSLVLIITSLFGINPHLSFAGDIERMWGINTWLHLVALFIVLSNVIKTKKDVFTIIYTLLIFSSYIAIYGYMQRLGVKGLFRTNVTAGFESFLGNSAYSAGALMVGCFLSLFLFFKTKKITSKIFAVICFALQVPALFLSSIRGAQLGFIVAVFLLLIFFLFKFKNKKVKIASIILILLLSGFLIFIFTNKHANFVKNTSFLNKLSTMFDLGQGTVKTRLISWSGGMHSFKENPVIGLGMENYYYAFDKYFQAEYYNIAATETWFDRAHNMFVEILVCNGIFGLLCYLFFIFAIIYALFKIYISDKQVNSFLFIFFLGMVLGYVIHNTFVFDSLGAVIMFFPILAIIEVYYTTYREKQSIFEKEIPNFYKYLIIGIVSFVVFYNIFIVNILHIKIVNQNHEVQKQFFLQNFQGVYEETQKLFSYNSYLNRDSTTMIIDTLTKSIVYANERNQLPVFFETINLVIDKLNSYLDVNEKDAYLQINLARLYLLKSNFYEHGSVQKTESLNLAKKSINKCLELSPERLHCYYFMGQVQGDLDNKEETISSFQKAVDLNPEYLLSSVYLGKAYKAFGETEKGDEILNRVYDLNPQLKEKFE